MKTRVDSKNTDIVNLWQTIRQSRGYQNWLTIDVSCYPLAVQIKIVVEHVAAILQKSVELQRSQEDDLDYLFNLLFTLCNDLLPNNHVNNVHLNCLFEQQNILYNKLIRVLYFVQ